MVNRQQKIVIFLNGERGYWVLNKLITMRFNVVQIVLGAKVESVPEVVNLAKVNNLAIHYSVNVNAPIFLEKIKECSADLFVVAGFSQIFSELLINIPRLGVLNLHAGKLPQYRGGSPLNWQIINGESTIGLSVILADKGIDTGNIVCESTFELSSQCGIEEAHKKANNLFPDLVVEAIDLLSSNFLGKKQNEEEAVYWLQRSKLDSRISFNALNADEVINIVRSLSRKYGGAIAYDQTNNVKLYIYAADSTKVLIRGTPGRVAKVNGNVYVVCKDKGIRLKDYVFDPTVTLRIKELLFD